MIVFISNKPHMQSSDILLLYGDINYDKILN